MMQLRVVCEGHFSPGVMEFLDAEPGVAHLTLAHGVGKRPAGDVIEAVIAREIAEDVLVQLAERGVHRHGEISLQPIHTMLSDTADAVERAVPGDSSDALIWDELVATTGEESRLNPVFLTFLTIACLLAAVGVVTDSAITLGANQHPERSSTSRNRRFPTPSPRAFGLTATCQMNKTVSSDGLR